MSMADFYARANPDAVDPQYQGWSESYKNGTQMEPQQEQHLASIKGEFLREVDAKYREGQKAHGGDLPMKLGMFKMLNEELLDGYVYYLTTRAQLRHVYRRIHELVLLARQGRQGVIDDLEQVGFYLEQIVEGDYYEREP